MPVQMVRCDECGMVADTYAPSIEGWTVYYTSDDWVLCPHCTRALIRSLASRIRARNKGTAQQFQGTAVN